MPAPAKRLTHNAGIFAGYQHSHGLGPLFRVIHQARSADPSNGASIFADAAAGPFVQRLSG
jgi:hypothetical protein